jgi:mono/diheme cytochrome c family protein
LAGVGCNALDPPQKREDGQRLVIPTDVRKPHRASVKPPPVTGGTLIVTRSSLAVASDPEHDTIVIADVLAGTVRSTIALEKGDEPGRLVEDGVGRVHVALRRGGAIVTIDPAAGTVLDRRAVCGAPRGLALSGIGETLEIACADGKLVTLPTGSGAVTRSVTLEPDLRDVVVQNGQISVSRLKSAEVLRLDASGAITRRDRPTAVQGTRMLRIPGQEQDGPFDVAREPVQQPFMPLVAWRTLAGPGGSTVVIHQRAVDAPIAIEEPSISGSSYGGGGGGGGPSCGGISQNAVTVIGPNGATTDMTFMASPLPVDAALLSDGRLIVVSAGPADPKAPRPFLRSEETDGLEGDVAGPSVFPGQGFTVHILSLPGVSISTPSPEGTVAPEPSCAFPDSLQITDPAVAVATNPALPTQVVVQTRQPSGLLVISNINVRENPRLIPFDDGSTLDTGYEIFHRDSGAGLACATCHAEGAEDGNVWKFEGFGERRTQALNIGLDGTAPFHWDGALMNVGALMSEVFVGRMGGVHESPERLQALEDWIFAMRPPAPLRNGDEAAVLRGKALFESPSTTCTTCHSGRHLTNNASRDVGTNPETRLQVPSLVGIGYRAPFMHDGCAKTLTARFDPACGGGESHGHTSHLSPEQIGDLVAYLESL